MQYTNRSLWFAVLACLSMGFFAKSPSFVGTRIWITGIFFFSTYILSAIGFWWGLKGTREKRTYWTILGPAINAFLFITFSALSFLLFRVVQKFQ